MEIVHFTEYIVAELFAFHKLVKKLQGFLKNFAATLAKCFVRHNIHDTYLICEIVDNVTKKDICTNLGGQLIEDFTTSFLLVQIFIMINDQSGKLVFKKC